MEHAVGGIGVMLFSITETELRPHSFANVFSNVTVLFKCCVSHKIGQNFP